MQRVKELCAFIREREAIRVKKEAGKPRPWTKDPILATYRFCNVRREDDAVTRWIATNWREPYKSYEDLWFMMVIARLFNLPSTLRELTFERMFELHGPKAPWSWNKTDTRRILYGARQRGPIFNGAYIVSTNGKAMDKVDYLIDCVLTPLWKAREYVRPTRLLSGPNTPPMSLEEWHGQLMTFDGLGSFMAAQVVADMKYVEPLKSAPDWHTWAASGPGSRRGLNRVCQRPTDAPWPGASWLATLHTLHMAVEARLGWQEPLHAQDLQNCLCEFDKYERARLGEGRPKQLYKEKAS